MPEFLLMFTNRPGPAPAPLPPDQLEALIARYIAWGERLTAKGHGSPRGGARLTDVYADPGRVVAVRDGQFVAVEGPLAETKEVVGGYGFVDAADYDEAVELCCDHPAAENGSIVIRQLA